jgi:hypothetical protein
MNALTRQHLKLANFIRERLSRQQAIPHQLSQQTQELRLVCQHIEAATDRLERCRRQGWHIAADYQGQIVGRLTRDLIDNSSRVGSLCLGQPAIHPPSLRDLFDDLKQLSLEFDEVEFNAKNHTLSITTDPILLDEVDLGPFKVTLDLKSLSRIGYERVYQVIALDPHPATSNDAVTHPHVRDEELCEGEASSGIRRSLLAGRVCDFFLLVRSVLQNYNSGSPYVALEDWEGTRCRDCDHLTRESYTCGSCDRDFCDNCISSCQVCSDSRCSSCLDECQSCMEFVCRSCRSFCEQCSHVTCESCLENQLCPDCREKEENYEPEPGTSVDEPGTGAFSGAGSGAIPDSESQPEALPETIPCSPRSTQAA